MTCGRMPHHRRRCRRAHTGAGWKCGGYGSPVSWPVTATGPIWPRYADWSASLPRKVEPAGKRSTPLAVCRRRRRTPPGCWNCGGDIGVAKTGSTGCGTSPWTRTAPGKDGGRSPDNGRAPQPDHKPAQIAPGTQHSRRPPALRNQTLPAVAPRRCLPTIIERPCPLCRRH